ncbi:hypothetical protein [Mesorhizobium sp. KR1-2]|uniref:hypothetical protein n=1 Tax=Mesorhizobium sp. KR1-2 TaxID=3156609 RepID=UPI0032B4B423
MRSWVEAGQPYELFWRLTLREINLVLDGVATRLRRDHNNRAWAVWHTAYLTAYAPEKPTNFTKLKSLLHDAPVKSRSSDWRGEFAAFSAWAEKGKS